MFRRPCSGLVRRGILITLLYESLLHDLNTANLMHLPSVPPPQLRRAFRRPPTKYRLQPTMESTLAGQPPSQELIQFLSQLHLHRFALRVHQTFGVGRAEEFRFVSDSELHSLGMAVVHIRQIRASTGPADPASQIIVQHARPTPSAEEKPTEEKHRMADHYAAPDCSRSAERTAASVAQGSERGCVPPSGGASPMPDHDPTSADHPDLRKGEEMMMMVDAMENKHQMSQETLQKILEEFHVELQQSSGARIKMCLKSALDHMSEHKRASNDDQAAKEAARAFSTVSRALATCPTTCPSSLALRQRLTEAQQTLRDLLILATQLQCPLGDRARFIHKLEVALEMAPGGLCRPKAHEEKERRQMLSQLMNSHAKVMVELLPNVFLSKAKCEALNRRGCRPARVADRVETKPVGHQLASDDYPSNEQDTCGASSTSNPPGDRPGLQSPPGLHHPADPKETRHDHDPADPQQACWAYQ